jgi:hypothetical protein
MQFVLFIYYLTSVHCHTVHQLRADWQVAEIIDESQTGKRCGGYVLEEFKYGVVFVRMFFGNEFIVAMEDFNVHLLKWK